MKYGKIMLFFSVSLAFSLLLRLLQLFFVVETTTGFFKPEFETIGLCLIIAIFVSVILAAAFAFTAHRCPQNACKNCKVLGIVSLIFSITLLIQIFFETFTLGVRFWQICLLKLLGVLTVAFFAAFGARQFIKFDIPKEAAIIPTLYLIIRIICDFTKISSLALISDNILLMGAYCSGLWFMLQFAKFYNKTDDDKGFRKLLGSGILASCLCITQSVPHIIMNFWTGYSYLHTSVAENLAILAMGVFVLAFVLTHFSKKNCCE